MFFEHTNSSLERQANILLRTGGGYEWKKIKAAVDLLYPQTYVNARRGAFDQNTGRGYGKSRTAHETQGHWDGNETYDTEVDLETWLPFRQTWRTRTSSTSPRTLPDSCMRCLLHTVRTGRSWHRL